MTAKERDLRVTVVDRYFTEGGDSIQVPSLELGAFASEAARQLTSFSD